MGVFRAKRAYARYWDAAVSVDKMRAEWFTSCASIVAFAQVSKKPKEEVYRFMHKGIRLFCLLHAMALEELADMMNENFPLIDIDGLSREQIELLTTEMAQGRKVEIVFQWIQIYIIQGIAAGMLDAPPPMLTRPYQYLGEGLVHFHSVQVITIWPFPFVYAQLNVGLLLLYMIMTPLVTCFVTSHPLSCGFFTWISVLCMLGVEYVAEELEHPFGDDANDLPVWEMQHDMNQHLLRLVDSSTWNVPELVPTARTTYEDLFRVKEAHNMALQQFLDLQKTAPPSWPSESQRIRTMKYRAQQEWATQHWSVTGEKLQRVLAMRLPAGQKCNSDVEVVPPSQQGIESSDTNGVGQDGDSPAMLLQQPVWEELASELLRTTQDALNHHRRRRERRLLEHDQRQQAGRERFLAAAEELLQRAAPSQLTRETHRGLPEPWVVDKGVCKTTPEFSRV